MEHPRNSNKPSKAPTEAAPSSTIGVGGWDIREWLQTSVRQAVHEIKDEVKVEILTEMQESQMDTAEGAKRNRV